MEGAVDHGDSQSGSRKSFALRALALEHLRWQPVLRQKSEPGPETAPGERIQSRLAFTDFPFTFPEFNSRNALFAMPRSTAT
jgi:hypothetical protein